MEPEPRKAPIRFYEIDALRFLAALAVVINHYCWRGAAGNEHYSPVAYPSIAPFAKYGLLGVQLFFIVSGFVVLLSAQGKTIKQFFLSRVTRLYPAYWAACTLTFIVERLIGPRPGELGWGPDFNSSIADYLVNLTMMQEFVGRHNIDGAAWSLAVELIFYFIISLVISYRLFGQLPLLCLVWLVFTAFNGPQGSSAFASLFIAPYAPYFVAGMAFYLLQNKRFPAWQLYGLLGFSYLLALRQVRAYGVSTGNYLHDPFSFPIMAGAVTVFFLIFFLIINRKINLQRFAWISNFGSITYPLYLVHSFVGYFIFQRLGGSINKWVLLVSLIAGMLVLAYLIHRFIEKKMSKPLGNLVDRGLIYLDRSA